MLTLLTIPPFSTTPLPAVIGAPRSVHVPIDVGAAQLAAARASLATASLTHTTPRAAPHPSAGSSNNSWLDVSTTVGSPPPARYLGTMAYDPVDQYVLLFGGVDPSTNTYYSDTWAFAHGQWTQLSPSNSPPARYVASMAWDAKDGYMVLFGGSTGTQVLSDTWTYVNDSWSQVTPGVNATWPAARWRAVMTYDVVDQYVLMFGGSDLGGTTVYKETWKFVNGTWADLTSTVKGAPAGRFRATMTWDAADGYAVMFGGCTLSLCPTAETWKYVNGTWSQDTASTHPSARVYTMMTYDAVHSEVLLFAGQASSSGGPMKDTWSFLNGSWSNMTNLVSGAPSNRGFGMFSYDPLDFYTVLYGGGSVAAIAKYFNDTWIFGPPILAQVIATPPSLHLGQTTHLNTTAISNSKWLNYSYWGLPPGCASANVSLLACTPNMTGVFPIRIQLNDTAGHSVNLTLTLSVGIDPLISVFVARPNPATIGTLVHFVVTLVGGTAPVGYRYSGLPGGCASANTANLSCRPSAAGTSTVEVNVTDATGFSVFSNVTFTANAKPLLTIFQIVPLTVDTGQSVNFTAVATLGTTPYTFSYAGLPSGCTTQNASRWSCAPSSAGTYPIVATVTDVDGWNSSLTANLTVNAAPVITGFNISSSVVDTGTTVTLWLNATGGTGTLVYSYSGTPGCPAGNTPVLTCLAGTPGTYVITGTASDAVGVHVHETVTLTVNALPTVNTFTVSPGQTDVGQPLNFSSSISGGTNPLAYTYTGLPTGCTAPSHTGNFSCVGHASGSFTVTVTVTDRFGQTAQGTALLTLNPPPKISSFAADNPSPTVGTRVRLVVSLTSGSGTGWFRFSYAGLPTGCTSSNVSTLSCTPTAVGNFLVSVQAHDAVGVGVNSSTWVNVSAATSGGSGSLLGLSSTAGYAVLIAIAAVVVLGIVLLLRRRRGGSGPAEAEPAAPAEPAGAPSYLETPSDSEGGPPGYQE